MPRSVCRLALVLTADAFRLFAAVVLPHARNLKVVRLRARRTR